ncbi:MAG: DVUA0089 family protein [Cyanobacteria bacterium P01_F01_bin.56]
MASEIYLKDFESPLVLDLDALSSGFISESEPVTEPRLVVALATQPIGIPIKLSESLNSSFAAWPELIYNSDNQKYVALWRYGNSGDEDLAIQSFSSTGGLLGENIQVPEEEDFIRNPDITYNGFLNQYLVNFVEPFSDDLFGQLLAANGNPIGNSLLFSDTAAFESSFVFNSNQNEYFQTSRRFPGGNAIFGQRIGSDGSLVSSAIRLDSVGDSAPNGEVAFNSIDDQYLTTWRGQSNFSDFTIEGRIISADGSFTSDQFEISNAVFSSGSTPLTSITTVFDPTNTQFLVAYGLREAGDVRAQLVDADGTKIGNEIVIINDGFDKQDSDVISAAFSEELGIYLVTASTNSGLIGQFVSSSGSLLEESFVISPRPDAYHNSVVYNPDDSQFAIAWDFTFFGSNEGIFAQLIEPPPVPTSSGTILGTKWHDLNGDGVRQVIEPTLAGWTIYLDQNQNGQLDAGETSTITGANGEYRFTNLPSGTYTVAEVPQGNWQITYPATAINLTGDLFSEVNDTLADALAIDFLSNVSATFTGVGFIGDNLDITEIDDDVDFVALQLAAYDHITIDIDAEEIGSDLDPILRLFDSHGNEISFSDDDPAPGDNFTVDSFIAYTIPTAGTYYVGVSSFANFNYDPNIAGSGMGDSTGEYTLEIIKQHLSEPTVFHISEANDTLANALTVDFLPNVSASFIGEGFIGDNVDIVETDDDVDLVALQLAANDFITIDIDADEIGSDLDPILRLFDSNGNEVRRSDDTPAPGEDFTLDSFIAYTVPTAGTYYVGVSSYDNVDYDPNTAGSGDGFSTGGYNIEIIKLSPSEPTGFHILDLAPGEEADNINFGNWHPITLFSMRANNVVLENLTNIDNTDIVQYDGTSFKRVFDGSDVGINNKILDAFDVISDTEILMSFRKATTIQGLVVEKGDIVKFNATQLGEQTAGSFEMYFDASDVDLKGGNLTALSKLDSGDLLLSMSSSGSVNGVSFNNEDVLLFSPTTLGDNTSGTFELYLDGSDIALTSKGEGITALAMAGEQILLSSESNFRVPTTGGALKGEDVDIFSFTPTLGGSSTEGTFGPELFFDGSNFGLTKKGNDVIAIDHATNPVV